jgi:hypothetical protein
MTCTLFPSEALGTFGAEEEGTVVVVDEDDDWVGGGGRGSGGGREVDMRIFKIEAGTPG